MPDPATAPLLSPENEEDVATESSPLLSDHEDRNDETQEQEPSQPKPSSWFRWPGSGKARKTGKVSSSKWRWPSIVAIVLLAILVILVMVLGFVVPPAVKMYAEHAAILEPTSLSVESITADGVRARIQANFRLDASRVSEDSSRRIGKVVTAIAGKLGTEETQLRVYLPTYDNALLGTAVVPPFTIHVANGRNNALDFVTDLTAGDAEYIRKIANDWLDGRLDRLEVAGKAAIHLKSGIFSLGTHDVKESMVFEAKEIPSIPDYQIERLNFHDLPASDPSKKAVGANVSITAHNDYPVAVDVPPLTFEILVPNCDPSEPYIMVAEAVTDVINVRPKTNVTANGRGVIKEIPKSLTRACPLTNLSPLDHFMKHYLHGEQAEIFVRGKQPPKSKTPEWIGSILDGITVPLELPGRSFGELLRNFSLADVHFRLPSPFADPSDPDSQARVSGTIEALAAIPSELNVDIGINSIRANADLYYQKKKLGELNLDRWQKAHSTKLIGVGGHEDLLNITSKVKDVPLNVTDGAVFSDLMKKMLFEDGEIMLDVKATVDARISTVLGGLVIKEVPAAGTIPVKLLPGNNLKALEPHASDLRILNTTESGFYMQALVNVSNPTPYTASIPYVSVYIFAQGHHIGEVVARDVDVQLGNNTDILVHATWDPASFGGEEARETGRRVLSDYISGKNVSLVVQSHRGSFPSMPEIGEALSGLNLTVPAPRFRLPGNEDDDDDDDDDDDGTNHQRFIREAAFHILSSSANFVLASPLQHNTLYVEYVNATAFYNHTEPVGHIISDFPFPAPPGLSQTPRLPVTWSPGHVGLDKLKKALGGSLKLDAVANVTLRLGSWVEQLVYEGKGIGAKIHL